MSPSILIIDDNEQILYTFKIRLESWGYRVLLARDGQTGLTLCESETPDLVLLDYKLPGIDGLEVLKRVKETYPWMRVIMLTAVGAIPLAVKAIKAGAVDYLTKPVDMRRLKPLIQNVLKKSAFSRKVRRLRMQTKTIGAFGNIIGTSESMQQVYRLIEQVSQTDATVLITGESGTGKELVARTIHELSPRQKYPFVPVNCPAITSTLWESEFFGHEKGSFTGAESRKFGVFERAVHGTLFLDEISEIPLPNQAKLLRVLEDYRVRRVGGNEEFFVNVRIIAATNRNLMKAIEQEDFRSDLYYRLNQFYIELPPLRDRKTDIPVLAEAFLADAASRYNKPFLAFTERALDALMNYPWPGNIRELKNAIERVVLLCTEKEIGPDHIEISLEKVPADPAIISLPVGTPLEEAERVLVQKTLCATGGNKTKAAKLLGISLRAFYNKLHKYRLMADSPSGSS
jgi:DNA-binding NtrC family response regulator